MFSQFTDNLYNFICALPFDTLVMIVWGSYLALYLLIVLLCIFSQKIKRAKKLPFLHLTVAYTGVNLAMFMLKYEFSQSVTATAFFFVVGYLLYGLLCLLSGAGRAERRASQAVAAAPVTIEKPVQKVPPAPPVKAVKDEPPPAQPPAAKNSVRLEHAISVTDKLLTKNLSKADRQELEKLKNTLAVLRIKGTLTPTEADILNDNFNALLKLMAKYNV